MKLALWAALALLHGSKPMRDVPASQPVSQCMLCHTV